MVLCFKIQLQYLCDVYFGTLNIFMPDQPTPKEQLLLSIEKTTYRLILFLKEEPKLLQVVLYLYQALYDTKEIIKKENEEWK